MTQQPTQDQISSISMAQAVLVPFPMTPPDPPTSCAPNTNDEQSQNLARHKLQVQQNILLQAAQVLTTHADAQSTLPHPLFSTSSSAASENDTKALMSSLSARWVPLPSRPRPVYTSATGQAGAGAGAGASGEWTSVPARVMLEAAGRLEEVEREVEKEGGAGGGGGGGRGGTWGAGGGSGAYDASRDPRLRR